MTKTYENFEEWLKEHDEAIQAEERKKVIEEFLKYIEKEMTIWINDKGDAIDEIYALAKAFIKEQNNAE